MKLQKQMQNCKMVGNTNAYKSRYKIGRETATANANCKDVGSTEENRSCYKVRRQTKTATAKL